MPWEVQRVVQNYINVELKLDMYTLIYVELYILENEEGAKTYCKFDCD